MEYNLEVLVNDKSNFNDTWENHDKLYYKMSRKLVSTIFITSYYLQLHLDITGIVF